MPGGNLKREDLRKGLGRVNEEEKISANLIEAIRVECGMSTTRVE